MSEIDVLVVEDNSVDRMWLENVLKTLGVKCTISSATDGAQAVDYLLQHTPDLIFLDVHLPLVDGIEVLRKVPGARDLPVCVLTSSEFERTQFKQEFGIQDANYLLKPVSPESLLRSSCIREVLL